MAKLTIIFKDRVTEIEGDSFEIMVQDPFLVIDIFEGIDMVDDYEDALKTTKMYPAADVIQLTLDH